MANYFKHLPQKKGRPCQDAQRGGGRKARMEKHIAQFILSIKYANLSLPFFKIKITAMFYKVPDIPERFYPNLNFAACRSFEFVAKFFCHG